MADILSHVQARARVEKANIVFGEVVEVLRSERHRYLIALLLQGCESSEDFLNLVWHHD